MNKTLSLLSGFTLLLVAETGFTYTVYNNSGATLKVWGEHCPACLAVTLPPATDASCPGDKSGCRGDTTITFAAPDFDRDNCYTVTAKVTDHGWVVITGGNGFFGAEVYDNTGKQLNINNTLIKPTDYKVVCGSIWDV